MWGGVGWGCDAAGGAWAGCVSGARAARCVDGLGRGLEWAVVQGRLTGLGGDSASVGVLSLWGRFGCWWTGRDAGCVGRGWLTPRWSRRSPRRYALCMVWALDGGVFAAQRASRCAGAARRSLGRSGPQPRAAVGERRPRGSPVPAQRGGGLRAAVGRRVPRRPTAAGADTPTLRSGASPRRTRRGAAQPPPRYAHSASSAG